MSSIESVAIVGAGPSGIIALESLLKEKQFSKISLFERRREAGGCWVYDEASPEPLPKDLQSLNDKVADKLDQRSLPSWDSLPKYVERDHRQRFKDSATYANLHTNVHYKTMEFNNYPFPEETSEESVAKYGNKTPFRHHTVVKKWLQSIIKKNNLEKFINYETSIELVEKNEKTGKWDLLIRRLGKVKDYLYKESFDSVIVASGRYDVPFIPYVEGLQEFHENHHGVFHTKQFRNKADFKDKRVVVVGASISAGDSVQDVLGVAKLPVHSSIRRSTETPVYFGYHPFEHEDVERHDEIVKVEGKDVHFRDGSVVNDVDVIIYGTGFSISYPFLPHLPMNKNKLRVKNQYQHVFNIEDPSLCFVGNITAGLTFKAFQWQAVLVAKYLSGKLKLPSKEEQYAWEDNKLKLRGDTIKYNNLYPDFKGYFEAVRELVESCEDKSGSKLPEWDQEWEDSFWRGHSQRIRYWKENNYSKRRARL